MHFADMKLQFNWCQHGLAVCCQAMGIAIHVGGKINKILQ